MLICPRSFAAATLELSQPVNEEWKAKALAAATNELERLFKKEDFGRMKVPCCFYLFVQVDPNLCYLEMLIPLTDYVWLRAFRNKAHFSVPKW